MHPYAWGHAYPHTNLPDQPIFVEANQPNLWPPPTLATIRNQSLHVPNNTNKPIIIDNKHTHSIKLTPATIVDTTVQPPATDYYKQYTPRSPTQLSDAETIDLIQFGKTEPDTKAFLDSVHR